MWYKESVRRSHEIEAKGVNLVKTNPTEEDIPGLEKKTMTIPMMIPMTIPMMNIVDDEDDDDDDDDDDDENEDEYV